MRLYNKVLVFLVVLLSIPYFASAYSGFFEIPVDFNNNVIDFREDGLMDNVRGGVLVHYSPLDLKVGSIFIDVDGIAKKVVGIQVDGDEIFIDTVQPLLREVFEFYDIPTQTIYFSQENLLPESLPEGATVSPLDREGERVSVGFEKVITPAKNMKLTLAAQANIDAGLDIGGRLPYTYLDTMGTWKPWKWKIRYVQGYAKGNLWYDIRLNGTVKAEFEKTWESKAIPLVAYGSPSPGFNSSAGLYTKTIVTGKLTLTDKLYIRIDGKAGAECGLDGLGIVCWPVNARGWSTTNFEVNNELSLEADVRFKQKLYLGASVQLFGFSIFEMEAGGGPYLRFNAKLAAGFKYSTRNNPKFSMWGSAEGSGSIGVFVEGEVSLLNGKWERELFSKEFPIYELSGRASGSRANVNDSYLNYSPNSDYIIQ